VLQHLINKLHAAQTSLAGFKKSEDLINQEIAQTELGKALKAVKENRFFWMGEEAVILDDLKKEALLEFERTHETKIMGVINVKEDDVIDPYDEAQAIEWCKINFPAALTLSVDKSVFEPLAKTGKIPFITMSKVSKVSRIASDLSSAVTVEVENVAD
jgi:hypothetical protein